MPPGSFLRRLFFAVSRVTGGIARNRQSRTNLYGSVLLSGYRGLENDLECACAHLDNVDSACWKLIGCVCCRCIVKGDCPSVERVDADRSVLRVAYAEQIAVDKYLCRVVEELAGSAYRFVHGDFLGIRAGDLHLVRVYARSEELVGDDFRTREIDVFEVAGAVLVAVERLAVDFLAEGSALLHVDGQLEVIKHE